MKPFSHTIHITTSPSKGPFSSTSRSEAGLLLPAFAAPLLDRHAGKAAPRNYSSALVVRTAALCPPPSTHCLTIFISHIFGFLANCLKGKSTMATHVQVQYQHHPLPGPPSEPSSEKNELSLPKIHPVLPGSALHLQFKRHRGDFMHDTICS